MLATLSVCQAKTKRHILQCNNARVLITDPRNHVVGLDAAHYLMLCALCNQSASETPTEKFLSAEQSSCLHNKQPTSTTTSHGVVIC